MLLEANRSALVVIDLQEKLVPAIDRGDAVVRQAGILLEAARTLDVPVVVTEQYPKGLGPTVTPIAEQLANDTEIISKLTFSAGKSEDISGWMAAQRAEGRDQAVICGTETHVCVLQTAADLKAKGAEVFLVTDASGSRTEANRQAGVARMAALGMHCVTTEMVLFEWLEVAGTDEFKQLSKLIR